MAKLRARAMRKGRKFYTAGVPSAAWGKHLALERGRTIKSEVKVYRTSGGGREGFFACVKVGRASESWRRCALGRTPRKAIANAMKQSAKHDVGARRGAFAGLKKGRK